MSVFFQAQMDYIVFVYGLAFVLLAAVCATMRLRKPQELPWGWLGLFGLSHGVYEWLEMLVPTLGDNHVAAAVRLGILVVSFGSLLEFGRASQCARTDGPGRWVYLPFVACALVGATAGVAGLNASIRYALALPGTAWTAWTLLRAARGRGAASSYLRLGAVAFVMYGLFAGAIVPRASFAPAATVNVEWFRVHTGIPVQLVRAVLAIVISASLWTYFYKRWQQMTDSWAVGPIHHGLQIGLALTSVLAIGWVVTDLVGRHGDRDIREGIQSDTRLAASLLNPERAAALQGDASDAGTPAYIALRQQMQRIQSADPLYRWVHLLILRAPHEVLSVADSVPEGKDGHMPPPDNVYRRPPAALFGAFVGKSVLVGPYADEWGVFLSGFAPLADPATGRIVAVLGIDVDASRWLKDVAEYRLGPIVGTLLVAILLIGFFVVRERLWETSQQIALQEANLAEAQQVAHLGSWTYDTRSDHMSWSQETFRILGQKLDGVTPSFVAFRERIQLEDWLAFDAAVQQALRTGDVCEIETRAIHADGTVHLLVFKAESARGTAGNIVRLVGTIQDITERKQAENALKQTLAERERAVSELQTALAEVKTLRGLLPICANCKKIRDTEGAWMQVESYIAQRSEAQFSHGICPECIQKLYPEYSSKAGA